MVNNSLEGTIVTLQCHAKYTRPDKATQFGLALAPTLDTVVRTLCCFHNRTLRQSATRSGLMDVRLIIFPPQMFALLSFSMCITRLNCLSCMVLTNIRANY